MDKSADCEKSRLLTKDKKCGEKSSKEVGSDEDDVPSDFFDDFSNQDFMDGLDIVDTWDEGDLKEGDALEKTESDELLPVSDLRNTLNKMHDSKPKHDSKVKENSKKSHDGEKLNRQKEETSFKGKEKTKGSETLKSNEKNNKKNGSKEKPSREKNHYRETDELKRTGKLSRRDPEKTKRDILRDKDKCAKDMENKVISEKLKVVETGLVPPGTEMEVDLLAITSKTESAVISKEKDFKVSKSRSPLIRAHCERDFRFRKRTPSHERLRRFSPGLNRRRSVDRNFNNRNQNRNRDHFRYIRIRVSRSPRRSRSVSIKRDTNRYLRNSREQTSYDKKEKHNIRDKKYRQLSSSPRSHVSERELWLRNRDLSPVRLRSRSPNYKRLRGRSRSKSPLYKKSRSEYKKDTSAEKLSFLQEIREKLNETTRPAQHMNPVPHHMVHMNPVYNVPPVPPMPVPVPVPIHNQYFRPQMPSGPQYDQEFFIGPPEYAPQPIMQPPMLNVGPPSNVLPIESQYNTALPVPVPAPNFHSGMGNASSAPVHVNVNNFDILPAKVGTSKGRDQQVMDKETVAELFENKKISLSDFLSITAKALDSSQPVDIENRFKVISRCQDAIKLLGGGSPTTGRLFIRKTIKESDKISDIKYVSPLRKKPFVRFQFTTPFKHTDDKLSFNANLIKLLNNLGISQESLNIEQPKEFIVSAAPSPVNDVIPPPAPKISSKTCYKQNICQENLGIQCKTKIIQTDPYKCKMCEIRNGTLLIDNGTQCAPILINAATQVFEEDLQPQFKLKGILKTQSLAHLTPAQLLAAQQDDTPSKFESMPDPANKNVAKWTNKSSLNLHPQSSRADYMDKSKLYPSGDKFPERYVASRFESPMEQTFHDDRYMADDRIPSERYDDRFPQSTRISPENRFTDTNIRRDRPYFKPSNSQPWKRWI